MINLCKTCNSHFERDFPIGECHICQGALENPDELFSAALAELEKHPEWKTFAISTSVPKKMLAREEEAWDYSSGESIKSWFNAELSKLLEEKTGKIYRPIGAAGRIRIDLIKREVNSSNEPLFLFGRYKKLVHGICQSKWICLKCGGSGCKHCGGKGKMYEESVEELIGDPLIEEIGGKYSFHACGREDIDVYNFAGRPFILEIKNPAKVTLELEKLKTQINSQGKIEVNDLKLVAPSALNIVTDSHFPKTYRAWVASTEELTEEDVQKLLSFNHILEQRTPTRVAHRRADLVRKRRAKVTNAKLEEGKIIIDVHADAGTYIKELIHSDEGRTKPSISSVLEKPCSCERLDVIGLDDDFIKFTLG